MAERPELDVEILDVADYPMGFYGDTSTTTAQAETADKWKNKLREFDAYILTAAEYNHAPTAVLKTPSTMVTGFRSQWDLSAMVASVALALSNNCG